jgi:hypothetical protein
MLKSFIFVSNMTSLTNLVDNGGCIHLTSGAGLINQIPHSLSAHALVTKRKHKPKFVDIFLETYFLDKMIEIYM